MNQIPRIALSTGEPAGIGPDLVILLQDFFKRNRKKFEVVVLTDPELLQERATQLGEKIDFSLFNEKHPTSDHSTFSVLPISCPQTVEAGKLNIANASYVMKLLDKAISLCQNNICQAMVTCPIQKSVLLDAGYKLQGHTEYLAEKTHTSKVVMMLASEKLRVALATTHLPLSEVSAALTEENLTGTIKILHHDLQKYFGIAEPTIFVCGLNPHAGEGGHLGKEEQQVIIPCLEKLRAQGIKLLGPLPADTIFSPQNLQQADAFLAMYHDQGLPVLKALSFGEAINITLGLPIIRTSVDHGTALTLAATGMIQTGSLKAAILQAEKLAVSRFN